MTRPVRQRSVRPSKPESARRLLRRLLTEQFAVIRKNEPRASRGSVEGLHDIRVALRRMRSLGMTFHKLEPHFLDRLDRRVAKACDRMGDARDLDVWIELFRDLARAGGAPGLEPRDRRAVLMLLRRERTRLAADALQSGNFRHVKRMLREHLRRRPAPKKAPPAIVFAARRMLLIRELIADRYRKVGNFSKGPAHDLRRSGRRMRYLAEFFAPLVGPAAVRAGRWITKAQAALGKVHDCDSALELSQDLPSGAARALVRRKLRQRRAAQLRKFKTAWRHYADRRLQKTWQDRLEAVAD